MAILLNGTLVSMDKTTVKDVRHIKEKVQWIKDNLSEDGKNLILVWDDSKVNKSVFHKLIKGFTQRTGTQPRGYVIPMYAMVTLFEGEGDIEVVYMRRPPALKSGEALNIVKSKEVFEGRMVIDLSRQPDLAFFMIFCSPLCRDGFNSDGSNVFKVQNFEKEAKIKNEAIRDRMKAQEYIFLPEAEGGLSTKALHEAANGVDGLFVGTMGSEEKLRNDVYSAIIDDTARRRQFVELAEKHLIKKAEDEKARAKASAEKDK